MDRKPCGPPSQRHQIPAGPRRTVSPASAKWAGRLAGRVTAGTAPSAGYGRMSAASIGVRTSVPVTSGHQARRPNTASPVASSEPQRSVPAPSTTRPWPSSASPWRGGRNRSSTIAASASVIRSSTSRTVGGTGTSARSASARAARPSSSTSPWYSVASSRLRPDRKVLPRRCRSRDRSASARSRAEEGNHPKAQDAANCPAASAITWLLAEDPRLGKAASQRWWCQIWFSATGLSSNNSAAPGQPSSSRRTHTHDSSRIPSSIPLVQCTPCSGAFAPHHDRRWPATRSAYRSSPVIA